MIDPDLASCLTWLKKRGGMACDHNVNNTAKDSADCLIGTAQLQETVNFSCGDKTFVHSHSKRSIVEPSQCSSQSLPSLLLYFLPKNITFENITSLHIHGMRSSLVVRASDFQCQSRNSPGVDPSILRHSGIWGAADEAMLNTVLRKKRIQENPPVWTSYRTKPSPKTPSYTGLQ
jgi:hypothetical protein